MTVPVRAPIRRFLPAAGVLLALGGISLLPACRDSKSSASRLAAALADARDRWEAAGLTSYSMTQLLGCECPPPHEWTVVVMNGVPAFIDTVDDPPASPDDYVEHQLALAQAKSVEQLFEWIGQQSATAATVDAEFDPDLGYPLHVFVDVDPGLADEEISWQITDLVPTGTCTKIGCRDELVVTLQSPSAGFAPGDYEVTVDPADGPPQVCTFTVPGTPCLNQCSLGGDACTAFLFPPDRIEVGLLDFQQGTVQVTVTLDGALVTNPYLSPSFTRSQPNGALCPPVCWTADVSLLLP